MSLDFLKKGVPYVFLLSFTLVGSFFLVNRKRFIPRRRNDKTEEEIETGFVNVPVDMVIAGTLPKLQEDDPRILKYIWDKGYLQAPSTEPYNLSFPSVQDPSIGQAEMVCRLLKYQRGGFFVECGALDGERHSNTLYMERFLGWKGLLIEADPKNYEMLLKKNRKAWMSRACLATKPYPHKVQFEQNFNIGHIKGVEQINATEPGHSFVNVQCFPFYSVLAALGVTHIDYFSLDVEGVESEVLEHIPFDKVFIKVISVEFSHVSIGKEGLRKFLENKDYVYAGELSRPIEPDYANDFIFIHKNFKHLITEGDAEEIVANCNGDCLSYEKTP